MKILITGGKSVQAMKLLKGFESHQVVLADYGEVPALSSSSYTFKSLGTKNPEATAHLLLNACLDAEIDMIFPLHAFEIEPLCNAELLFSEFNIHVALPDKALLSSCFHFPAPARASKNWLLVVKGAVLFSTEELRAGYDFPDVRQLSGVFYIHKDVAGVANLELITI